MTAPRPKRLPQETWVVETGMPNRDATVTSPVVMRFAVNPWPWFMGVILSLMVWATFFALSRPPTAMATPTISIASQAEIEAALHSRQSEGRHIIPVPEIEVKRATPHIVIDSIRVFLRRGLRRKRGVVFEKTVVSPHRQRGQVTVSEAALSQMIIHCVAEFEPSFRIDRLVVSGDARQPAVEVVISGEYHTPVAGRLHELRDYIIRTVERYSGLVLDRVDVTLGGMA